MKKLFVLTMCLVLAFSINALAVEGNPQNGSAKIFTFTSKSGPMRVWPPIKRYMRNHREAAVTDRGGVDMGNQNGSGGGKWSWPRWWLLDSEVH